MVGELHKRGFQRMRIAPGTRPTGAWRCHITSADNITSQYGALLQEWDPTATYVATYSSRMGNEYFQWRDARDATVRQLATLFVERFPEIAERSRGRDWSYAGWYVEMLGTADLGYLPYAYHGDPPGTSMAEGWPSLPTTSQMGDGPAVALPPVSSQ